MRILSLSTLFPSAARPGFGLFVARQAEAVAGLTDIELTVVHPVPAVPPLFDRVFHSIFNSLPASARQAGFDVHYPRFLHVPLIGWRWNPALVAHAVLPFARRLHAEAPFDLVDAQFFYPDGPAAARIAAALRLPLTIKARGSDIHLWGARPAARTAMVAAARQAAGLLAVSEALKRDMAALGMPADRIAAHYTGLNHTLFRPLARADARATLLSAFALPADGALLVSVGNLIAIKGQDLAIRALAELPGARLALAGKGPQESGLLALAADLGLADRVHVLGSVPPSDMAMLLAAADAMVLPSQREGLANAWVEALACGAPLVIPDVGGAREVVRSAAAGRIAARNPGAIAAAVKSLLADPPPRDAVAAEAARFSWDANARQLAAFWRQAAGR